MNTRYAHGARLPGPAGRRVTADGGAAGRGRPADPGARGPDRGGPHLQGRDGGPGRPRACEELRAVDRRAAGRGARPDAPARRPRGRARVGARPGLRPGRARGDGRGRRARRRAPALRERGRAPVRAAPGPLAAAVADRLRWRWTTAPPRWSGACTTRWPTARPACASPAGCCGTRCPAGEPLPHQPHTAAGHAADEAAPPGPPGRLPAARVRALGRPVAVRRAHRHAAPDRLRLRVAAASCTTPARSWPARP